MKKRGRKSGASLSVISNKGVEVVARPDAPAYLTDEQAAEWTAVVERMPADWFTRENFPLLAQYCRHIVAVGKISQLIDNIEASDEFDIDGYNKLLAMHSRESAIMIRLATNMRLTQQAKYTTRAAATASKNSISGKKPWDK